MTPYDDDIVDLFDPPENPPERVTLCATINGQLIPIRDAGELQDVITMLISRAERARQAGNIRACSDSMYAAQALETQWNALRAGRLSSQDMMDAHQIVH